MALSPKDAALAMGYGLLYFALASACNLLFTTAPGFSSLWLPAGLAVAVFVLCDKKLWLPFAICQFAANMAFNALVFRDLPLALVYSLANLAVPIVGAWLTCRFANGPEAFERLSTTVTFTLTAALAGPALGATISLIAMSALGRVAVPIQYWTIWIGSDALGVLVIAVPIIVWFKREKVPQRKLSMSAALEILCLLGCLLATLYVGFISPASSNPVFRYLVMPVLLWAGIRFPARVVSLINVLFIALMYLSMMFTIPAGSDALMKDMPAMARIFFLVAFIFDFIPCIALAGLRNAERSLRLSEAEALRLKALYQDLLETSQDLIWQCDAAGRLMYLNSAWDLALGFTHDEMIGKKYYDFFEPAYVKDFKAEIDELMKKDNIMGREIRLRKKNGGSLLLMCNIKAVKGASGAFEGGRGTAYDITERRRLEEAMYNDQKQESLGVLAGGLAHDFNNLLGGVFGFMELAMKANDIEKARGYLNRTLVPFQRAKDLTRQLLTFSKGGTPTKRKASIAETLHESIAFALAGRNVQADFGRVEALPDFAFDPNQMSQVFQNIAINACEAMPEGGRLNITIDEASIDPGDALLEPGKYARIVIRDQGAGIPSDILPRVFDPFFTTKSKGSGLGLAICYSIVAKHKGLITVESPPGSGALFRILLPLHRSSPAEAEADFAVSERRSDGFRGCGRALVMDDEGYMRELGIELLGGLGYEALSAEDGDIALSIFSRAMAEGRPIRLALLDLTVPGGRGGLETVTELRKAYGNSIRVIASSGYAEDPVIANPVEYGFDGALAKPFMAGELQRLLQKLAPAERAGAPQET